MYPFDESNQNQQMPYQPDSAYVDATSDQPLDDDDVYDDDAETEAFLANKRQVQSSPPLFGRSNVPPRARMPKAEALSIARKLKGLIIAGSLVAFGILSTLVASNTVSASASQTNPSSPSSGPDTNSGSNSTIPSSGGNYFQQQQGGGYGFGNKGNRGFGSENGGSNFGQSPSVSGSQAS